MGKHESTGEGAAALHAAVEAVTPGEWRAVPEDADVPEQARAESQYWSDQIFSPEANPHDAPGARRAIHRAREGTVDLIRHDYRALGLDLSVFEGRNFVLVRIARGSLDLLALPEVDRPAAIAQAAEALFQARLGLERCEVTGEGETFSTGANKRSCASWVECVEAGIRRGELWFVCHKRIPQLVGFLNPAQWFDEGRREVARRTRVRR